MHSANPGSIILKCTSFDAEFHSEHYHHSPVPTYCNMISNINPRPAGGGGGTLAKKSNWTFRDPIGSIWNPIGPGLAQLDNIISNWTFDRSNWTRGSFNRTPKSPIGSIILLDNVNWIKMNHGSRTFRNRYAVAILLLYFHFSIFTTSGKCVERLVLRTRRSPARGPPKTSKR